MPGSGDSIQALKAGIMEIPDVIAINKMDHPAAKTMLNEVRSVLSLDRDRAWKAADRADRGRARRRTSPELWEKVEEHRAFLERERPARRAAPAEPGGRGLSRSRPRGRARICERAVADDPELRRAARRRAAPRARPADGGRARSCREGVRSSTDDARQLADIERARERPRRRSRASRLSTARRRSRASPAATCISRPRTSSARARSRSAGRSTRSRRSATPSARAGVVAASAGNHGAGGRLGGARGGRRARRSSSRRTRRWRRSRRRRATARRSRWCGESFEEALAAALEHVRGDGRDVRPPVTRTSVVVAGQGTIGLELAEQLAAGDACSCPIGGGGLAAGIAASLLAVQLLGTKVVGIGVQAAPDGIRARGRDRGQEAGRADQAVAATSCWTTWSRSRPTRSRQAIVAPARAHEARRRGRRRASDRGAAGREGPGRTAGGGRALRRQHRRQHADRRSCGTGVDHGRPASRRAHIGARPARRSCSSSSQLVAEERVNVLSVEHRRGGVDIPGRRDGHRPDAARAR